MLFQDHRVNDTTFASTSEVCVSSVFLLLTVGNLKVLKSWLSVSGVNNWICRMAAQMYEEEWNKRWDRFPMKACHILTGLRWFSFISYSFAGSAVLFLFIYILTWLRWWVLDQPRPQNYSNIILWKALVLSNCGKFLMIPSLIWGEIGTEMHSLFIMGYTFLSQLKVYSGKCIFYSILDIWFGKLLLCALALVLVQFVICLNIDSTQICLHIWLWSSEVMIIICTRMVQYVYMS